MAISLILILVTFILILGNAFFVLAEFALVSIRSTKLEELVKKGHRRAKMAQFAVKHIDGYLSAVQLGISAISLAVGWIGEPAVAAPIHSIFPHLPFYVSGALSYSLSFAFAFTLVTGVHITLGEQVPKLIAIFSPEKALMLTIAPLTAFYYAAYGPMLILNGAAHFMLRLLGQNPSKRSHSHSDEEIRILLDRSEEEGRLSLDRLMMFENLFDFGHSTVKEIMTLRDSIAFLSLAKTWEENMAVLQSRRYSRFPLCAAGLDTIIGYVHIKDLAYSGVANGKAADLTAVRHDIAIIKDDVSLEDCLSGFQQRRGKIALVQDTAGMLVGLVTTEDIIEEIVGEIRDEFEATQAVALSSAIVPQAAGFDLTAATRFEAVKKMLKTLHSVVPLFDFNETLNLVYKREQGLPSAVGHQTAFPHARGKGLARPLIAFARSGSGVDFRAAGGQRVKLIFLILTPFNEPTAQLRLLSQLARLISNDTLNERLLDAVSAEELMEIVTSFEEKIPV